MLPVSPVTSFVSRYQGCPELAGLLGAFAGPLLGASSPPGRGTRLMEGLVSHLSKLRAPPLLPPPPPRPPGLPSSGPNLLRWCLWKNSKVRGGPGWVSPPHTLPRPLPGKPRCRLEGPPQAQNPAQSSWAKVTELSSLPPSPRGAGAA